jgi:uncharacterized membrane protein YhhN
MVIWLVLALVAALFEAAAVQRNARKLEFFAKPAVMIFLLVWLYATTGIRGDALWFGLGILFSMVGDIALLSASNRMFMIGLIAFLLTHIFYLVGFKNELLNLSVWSFLLMFFIFINGLRLLRRIAAAMRTKGENGLVIPVVVYGLIISLMLYAAMSTIYDPAWTNAASALVSIGALLFWISDLFLAWNKFVSPIKNGRVPSILAYHLGQIGLIAGVISQLGYQY